MASSEWHIKNVPIPTRRKIKAWAAINGLELGQALAKLIEIVEKVERQK